MQRKPGAAMKGKRVPLLVVVLHHRPVTVTTAARKPAKSKR